LTVGELKDIVEKNRLKDIVEKIRSKAKSKEMTPEQLADAERVEKYRSSTGTGGEA